MHKVLSVLSFFILLACTESSGDIYMKSVNNAWQKEVSEDFTFNIDKNDGGKDILLVVRNNEDYPYSNIRFFIKLENIKMKSYTIDTLNYLLAKPNGEWLGTGFGRTKEILFQYKMNYQFPNSGEYKIEIKQAMRKDTLVGIEDIGIKIENTKL